MSIISLSLFSSQWHFPRGENEWDDWNENMKEGRDWVCSYLSLGRGRRGEILWFETNGKKQDEIETIKRIPWHKGEKSDQCELGEGEGRSTGKERRELIYLRVVYQNDVSLSTWWKNQTEWINVKKGRLSRREWEKGPRPEERKGEGGGRGREKERRYREVLENKWTIRRGSSTCGL